MPQSWASARRFTSGSAGPSGSSTAPWAVQHRAAPAAVADLVTYAYWSAGAREAADGQTVYSAPGGGTRLGERLTDAPLTLRGDPAEPHLECAPFVLASGSDATVSVFDNGLPLRRTAWIDHGVLAALVQTRHSAALTGMLVTPHIDNLVLEGEGASGSLDDLVAGLERGLLLTTVWYIREVDPSTLLLTGLTRDGVFLVEGARWSVRLTTSGSTRAPWTCSAGWSEWRRPSRRAPGSGARHSPTAPCRRCWWRISTCRQSAMRCDRPPSTLSAIRFLSLRVPQEPHPGETPGKVRQD